MILAALQAAPEVMAAPRPAPGRAIISARVKQARPGFLRRVINRLRPRRDPTLPRKVKAARKGPGYVVRSFRWKPGAPLSKVQHLLKKLPSNWQIAVRGATGYYFQEVGWVLKNIKDVKGATLMDGKIYRPRNSLLQKAAKDLVGKGDTLLASEEFFDGKQTIKRYYQPRDLPKLKGNNIIGLEVVKPANAAKLQESIKGLRGDELVEAKFARVVMKDTNQRVSRQGEKRVVHGLFRANELKQELAKGQALSTPRVRRLQAKGEPKAARLTFYRTNRRQLWGKGQTGPKANAVRQGATLGDCWMLAALDSVTRANPNYVKNMIRERKGGYEVRLFVPTRSGKMVRTWVPVSSKTPRLAGLWTHYARSRQGKWVSLVEKAAAKVAGSYKGLNAPDVAHGLNAFELLVGNQAKAHKTKGMKRDAALKALHDALASGKVVTASTHKKVSWLQFRRGVVGNHRYAVKSVDMERGTVALQNPWGWANPKRLPVEKFLSLYEHFQVADVPGR